MKSTYRTYTSAYLKCGQIWRGCKRSKSSEAIHGVLLHQLPYPVCTRWGTDFKCIKALLAEEEKEPGSLKKLLAATKTDARSFVEFTTNELSVLSEYIQLTAPLALGIDNLQGEKDTFYGDLLPTLFSIKAKLEGLMQLPKLGKLAERLIQRLVDKRFVNEFELNEGARMAICGAISCPRYKAQWGTEEDSSKAMEIFKREFEVVSAELRVAPRASDHNQTGSQRSFIQLRPSPLAPEASELTRYLVDQRTHLKMLDEFPVIREIFFKNNTQLPTSAQPERMFNFCGILDHPKRCRIMPKTFEDNIVIKANAVFTRENAQL